MAARGLPPVVHLNKLPGEHSFAGKTEAVLERERHYLFLDCYGADSTQTLNEPLRAHMIEVSRVWFNVHSTVPADNTLYLCFENLSKKARTNIYSARTHYGYNPLIDFTLVPGGDAAQEVLTNQPTGLAMIIPLGNVIVGDNVVAENRCRNQLLFAADSIDLNELRVTLRQSDGTVWQGLQPVGPGAMGRLFVEFYVFGEKRR